MSEPPAERETALPPVLFAVALVGIVALGLLAGLIEVLLVPIYVGSTPLGLAALLAIVGNVVIPRLGYALTGRTAGAVAALLAWLAAVIVLALSRPEGDVLLPGGPGAIVYVTYAVLLGGVLAGVLTVGFTGIRRAAARSPGAPAGRDPDQAGGRR